MVIFAAVAVALVVELYVFVQVAQSWGFLTALLIVIAVSLGGVALVKREGLRTLARFQAQVREGKMPSRELADAVLLLIAGGLLVFPGLATGVLGLIVLLPPVRTALRYPMIRAARRVSVRRWG